MQTQSDFLVSHRPFQGFQDLLQVVIESGNNGSTNGTGEPPVLCNQALKGNFYPTKISTTYQVSCHSMLYFNIQRTQKYNIANCDVLAPSTYPGQ